MLAAFLAFLGLVLRFGVDLRLGQVERREQPAGSTGEGTLVRLCRFHLGQRGVGAFAQRVAPQIEDALRRGRRFLAGHLFPRQQGERRGDRQLVLAGHAVVAFGLAFLRQLGAQVGRDAGHVLRADHFHAGLLQRVVGVLRLAAGRHARGVQRVVVVAQAQAERVGGAAQPSHLGRGQRAGRQRQARALAGQAGGAGLERHLHVGLFRDGAQHAGGGALEVFGACVVLLAAAAHGSLTTSGQALARHPNL